MGFDMIPRSQADAAVAAAYEAAADVLLDRGTNVEDPIAVRKDILALTAADAKAALDRLIAEARHAHRELVEELEAELAKAVETLVAIERAYYQEASNPDPATIRRMAAKMRGFAQATLAELKGE